MSKDSHFIAFETRLRAHRCQTGVAGDWRLSTNPGRGEQMILTQALHDLQTAVLSGTAAANSTRPDKAPSGANKLGQCKDFLNGACKRAAACKFSHPGVNSKAPAGAASQHVPAAFASAHSQKVPLLCMRFAYFGKCTKKGSTAASCVDGKNAKLLHTCALCGFKNGKHDVKDGKHPSGTCP
jgi:hypothetical protein